MAGLVPAIHASVAQKDVDARVKPGHDDGQMGSTRLALVADRAEMLVDAEHDQDEFRGDP
jgi:hypothetical protein